MQRNTPSATTSRSQSSSLGIAAPPRQPNPPVAALPRSCGFSRTCGRSAVDRNLARQTSDGGRTRGNECPTEPRDRCVTRQDHDWWSTELRGFAPPQLASDRQHARSPVSTVPPGSARATTNASTADPARARRRSVAALRAVVSLTVGSTMHIFRNRSVLASRLGSPRSDTRTIVGTSGGHSSCALSAPISESAVLVRAERRETPPLSRTSMGQPTRSSDRSRMRRAIASAVAR